jgi:membrane protease YdiL (CAAX protease family)
MSNQPEPDTENDTGEPLDDRSTRNLVVGLAIAVEGGLIAVAWLLGWLVEVPVLDWLRFTWEGVGWGLAATVPMLAGFFLAARWPVGPLRSIRRFTDETMRPMMAPCSLIDLAGISLLAGLGEELLFRGVIQQAFSGWIGVAGAIAVSALLFGLLHAVTPSYAIFATLMGVYMGLVFHWTDNLLPVILAHALYDFVALVWVTRGPGSDVPPPQDAPDETDG